MFGVFDQMLSMIRQHKIFKKLKDQTRPESEKNTV